MNIYEYIYPSEDERPLDRIVSDGGMCAIFRTIACIGDSLSSGEFEWNDGTVGGHCDMYEYSWGQFMARSCGNKVYNFSQGGMTAKRYIESFAPENGYFSPVLAAQAYIIALGINDVLNKGQPIGKIADIDPENCENNADTFAGYYGKVISMYKKIQPDAKFFLVTMPLGDDPERNSLKRQCRDLIEEVTGIFDNCYLIDLFSYAPVMNAEYGRKFSLGYHRNPAGYLVRAKTIESYIDYIIRHNLSDFKQVGFIGTPYYNVSVKK